MRETKLKVFYYPGAGLPETTLKKAMLLFDELHIMDHPSFNFAKARCGFIGESSPLRGFETLFREQGFPLYVHRAPHGIVEEKPRFYERIAEDVNDTEFLRRFQSGLKTSRSFRDLHIAPGNYGEAGDQDEVAQKLIAVDLESALKLHDTSMALFEDNTIRLNYSNHLGCAKNLVFQAVGCSARLNFALGVGTGEGFIPLADATPYGDLVGAKHARAIDKLRANNNKIQLTDLSFAIFDELIPEERLDKLDIKDVIRYRKASDNAREAFLEYLVVLQAKQGNIGAEGDYSGAVQSLVTTEILPAARTFKNKLDTIGDTMFGKLVSGVVTYCSTAAAVDVFLNLSWDKLLLLAGAAGAPLVNAAIESYYAERAAKRECSISYVLSLDT